MAPSHISHPDSFPFLQNKSNAFILLFFFLFFFHRSLSFMFPSTDNCCHHTLISLLRTPSLKARAVASLSANLYELPLARDGCPY